MRKLVRPLLACTVLTAMGTGAAASDARFGATCRAADHVVSDATLFDAALSYDVPAVLQRPGGDATLRKLARRAEFLAKTANAIAGGVTITVADPPSIDVSHFRKQLVALANEERTDAQFIDKLAAPAAARLAKDERSGELFTRVRRFHLVQRAFLAAVADVCAFRANEAGTRW